MNLYYGNYDSPDEKIQACNAALTLWSTLIYDGNYQFYHCRIQKIYLSLAYCYAGLQKSVETIDAFRNALFHARAYDDLSEGEQNYSSIFVKTVASNRASYTKNYTETTLENVKSHMRLKAFDFLRKHPEFIELRK